eukprot:TRINITY_DN62942_c0_g1_i1.p1 TRINITY_DN62942_c0_g1~~TRINITY_DN62942_c0_g1_i1.p1  ORF type:complete len:445 (+),score=130.75 TRINITY_DN62942_c0_g1_i1:67-1401(+)
MAPSLKRLLSAAAFVQGTSAAHWAVIVAGSNGFENYRHQADTCHAYQVVKAKGIPEDNIIMLAYDDVAHNEDNPFPGKLYNKPDAKGTGKDVYAGCKIDYKGKDVNPDQFMKVLTGNATGKALKSNEEDDVFIYFADHGAPGLIAFPDDEFHKEDLQSTLKKMRDARMFKKLVFYLEACESGSMFEGMSIPGVYAVSAANGKESSWGTYCGDDAVVNNKNIGSCLGDLFSVAWLEDSDAKDLKGESLQQQYSAVKTRTSKSHVLQWGDLSFTKDSVAEFVGDAPQSLGASNGQTSAANATSARRSAVSARHVDLHAVYHKYVSAATSQERLAAAAKMQSELAKQQAVESVYAKLAALAYPGDADAQSALRHDREPPVHRDCEMAGHAAIRTECAGQFNANSGFALQFHQVVVNLCAAVSRGLSFDVVAAARQACGSAAPAPIVV